jgi:hypothetical protein
MALQQLTNLFLKRVFSMLFGLVGDVGNKRLSVGRAYRECAVAVSPPETVNTLLGRTFRAGLRLRIAPRAKALGYSVFPLRGKADVLLTLTPIGSCRISRAASNAQDKPARQRRALPGKLPSIV